MIQINNGLSSLTSLEPLQQFEQMVNDRLAQHEETDQQSWQDLVNWLEPHEHQRRFIDSPAKRKVVRAGRRGGKTVGVSLLAGQRFLRGRRQLYAAPTQEQIDRFWTEIKRMFEVPLDTGALYKNETLHVIEVPGTEQRIRAKTAWDADSLRGDYADDLYLDEFQLMNEEAWGRVGAPMLADNNGDAVFIYTPPSLHSRSRTKARDPQHAAKLYQKAASDTSGRWAAFHFTSFDNPHISHEALDELTEDMTALAYEQEIMAEDRDEAPGALWTRELLTRCQRPTAPAQLVRVVIGVDPPGGATECGIVVAGLDVNRHAWVLDDVSLRATPREWADAVIGAYQQYDADRIVGEANYGGDMVENTIRQASYGAIVSYKSVVATRGKAVRAEPVAAQYERGRVFHVGEFPGLEDELCMWEPGVSTYSPNRLDALVWALTDLMLGRHGGGNLRGGRKVTWRQRTR
jgi:hypothetical protein